MGPDGTSGVFAGIFKAGAPRFRHGSLLERVLPESVFSKRREAAAVPGKGRRRGGKPHGFGLTPVDIVGIFRLLKGIPFIRAGF
jgi:hypothetical protein